jgi:hypothetical protein
MSTIVPRQTKFGKSLAKPTAIQKPASRRKNVFPSGVAAANVLGLFVKGKGDRFMRTQPAHSVA